MATPNEGAKTFRPGNSVLKEPSFRFLALPTGVEGERGSPLEHLWQIPIILSILIANSNDESIIKQKHLPVPFGA